MRNKTSSAERGKQYRSPYAACKWCQSQIEWRLTLDEKSGKEKWQPNELGTSDKHYCNTQRLGTQKAATKDGNEVIALS
jgi:hypothetical protein